MRENKIIRKIDVTIGNTHVQRRPGLALAVSRVAAKQSVKREGHTRFTRGVVLPSLLQFHDDVCNAC